MKKKLGAGFTVFLLIMITGCVTTTTAEDALKDVDLAQKQDKVCVRQCLNTYSRCVESPAVLGTINVSRVLNACASSLRLCVDTCE